MSMFKCKMCGGTLEVNNNETVGVCEYCGTKQTLPKLDNERKSNLYDRANHFRRNDEFDKAMSIYEQILNEDRTDAESYWSIVLCRYGIEYVEDPTTHKRIPTVNRTQLTSIFDDEDYKSALRYADRYQREIYENEATVINEIQKGILAISQKEEPFDVFICYKETDKNGRRTQDSVLAQELYYELLEEGFKVFFAKITLEDKLGQEYEPYIFAALNSAKVMVVLGTKPEHFNAVWVKNEWSRYLALTKKGENKMLIPAYRDMDPYDLPEEFSHLQAQDMEKLGFMQDLVRGIKKIVTADSPTIAPVVRETVVASNVNIESFLKRVFMFLEDGDWTSADEYCEKVLDIEPENAQAYLGKLMAELQVKKQESLKDCTDPFDNRNNYKKVLRFADGKLVDKLNADIAYINERNEESYKNNVYQYGLLKMKEAKTEEEFEAVCDIFDSIANYKDANELRDKAEVARKTTIYETASKLATMESIVRVEQAIEEYKRILGFSNSQEQIEKCHRKIEEIKAKEEEERLERERIAEQERIEAEKKTKRNKKIIIIVMAIAVSVLIVVIILNITGVIPLMKYHKAIEAMEKNNYDDAIAVFEELDDFKNSQTYIKETKYNQAIDMMNKNNHDDAIDIFEKLGDYKNSQEYIKETKYREAVTLMSNEEYEAAYFILVEIRGYRDVNQFLEDFAALPGKKVAIHSTGAKTTENFTYDSNGNCIKEIITYSDGDQFITEYSYDSNENCVKKVESDGQLIYEYSYDENNKLVRETYKTRYNSELLKSGTVCVTNYSYDGNGNCIKKVATYTTGARDINEWIYDDKGMCIKNVHTDSSGDQFIYEWNYDDNGMCTKEIYTNSNGERTTTEYSYDVNGNCTKAIEISRYGIETVYEYTYDNHYNCIKEVESDSIGKPIIVEYQYEDYQVFYHPKQ